jgi:hypothetical protein
MADNASAPLANFLIDRNKELELLVTTLREETDSVDSLETSLRYTRGLLTNYIELNTESDQLLQQVQTTHHSLVVWIASGFVAAAAVASMSFVQFLGTPPDNASSLGSFLLIIIAFVSMGWLLLIMSKKLHDIRGAIETHVKSVAQTKGSNHLFDDILDPGSDTLAD